MGDNGLPPFFFFWIPRLRESSKKDPNSATLVYKNKLNQTQRRDRVKEPWSSDCQRVGRFPNLGAWRRRGYGSRPLGSESP